MNQFLYDLISQVDQISLFSLFLHIAMSALIGLVIYLSYWLSHTGTIYSKKFNVSLVTLTILTATVMAIIGNNIALSLGMVGALSIVRFRTAIKDSRDTVYIFLDDRCRLRLRRRRLCDQCDWQRHRFHCVVSIGPH